MLDPGSRASRRRSRLDAASLLTGDKSRCVEWGKATMISAS